MRHASTVAIIAATFEHVMSSWRLFIVQIENG